MGGTTVNTDQVRGLDEFMRETESRLKSLEDRQKALEAAFEKATPEPTTTGV